MKKILASIMGTILGLSCAMGQSATINIKATNIWVDSYIYVTNGQSVTINANGNWTYDSGAHPLRGILDDVSQIINVPDGFFYGTNDTDIFLDNGIHAGVVAYIGTNPFVSNMGGFPQASGYWEIGSSGQFISNTNGYLWVGMQDDANTHHYSDNDGSVNAQIFLNYGSTNSDWPDTRPVVSVASVSATSFQFNISDTNYPNSFWAIYDSSDLKNWVLAGAVTLNNAGAGSFTNTTGVPYRFYKVSNGQTTSRAIGFDRINIPTYSTNLIANQLDSGNNTLDGLFNQTVVINGTTHNNAMPDGTSLPSGTVVSFWNGTGFNDYTWSGTGWTSGGSTVLAPGGGAFIRNNSATAFTTTFVGLIEEGQLTVPWTGSSSLIVSSKLPQAGGLKSISGFNGMGGDLIEMWQTNNWVAYFYDPSVTPPWDDGNQSPTNYDPVVTVGQPIFLVPNGTGDLTNYFLSYP